MQAEYVLYGAPFSLFTRKLEAALRFYAAPFRLEPKNPRNADEVQVRSGSHQVPVLGTPEGWMIADTTPILALLDARYPQRRMLPEGPAGVLVHVVEEVIDEWLARVMVHFRWHYAENTRHIVSTALGRSVSLEEARDFPLANWGRRACRATGTEPVFQREAAEREYLALLSALEAQLAHTPFALGDRPTAVDAILLGGLRAHTNNDPIPDLADYPRVVAWDEREADRWAGEGEVAAFPEATPFADHVLELGRMQYQPFLLANAEALAAGEKAFSVKTYGEEVSYLARPYPEQSRRMIHERIRWQLSDAERARVGNWLEQRGLAPAFMP